MPNDIIHKSKIGIGILAFLIIVLGGTSLFIIVKGAWVGLIAIVPVIALILNIYTGTSYAITANRRLVIKCGIIETYEIQISDIFSVRKSNAVWSSPALSLDRLEIIYKGGSVLISPKDKKKFVEDLRKVNPKI